MGDMLSLVGFTAMSPKVSLTTLSTVIILSGVMTVKELD